MIDQLKDFLFQSWYHFFLGSFSFFLFLYFFTSVITYAISLKIHPGHKIGKAIARKQILSEINLSLISIAVFALQSILIQQGVYHGWISISWEVNTYLIPLEIVALFIWNEIHFYTCHWLLHRRWLYKKIHYQHHQSHSPSPFSTYSFHWAEAFLLGSVIFLPIIVYNFQYVSLLSLPVMSILLNVLGHWDYDLFPKKSASHWSKFSYRHSMHHQKVKGNYGFFLTFPDTVFKTSLNDKHN